MTNEECTAHIGNIACQVGMVAYLDANGVAVDEANVDRLVECLRRHVCDAVDEALSCGCKVFEASDQSLIAGVLATAAYADRMVRAGVDAAKEFVAAQVSMN